MDKATNYLNKSNAVSQTQYVNLRRWGYLIEEIDGVTQEFYTKIKSCLESDGLKPSQKPMTDLQERFLEMNSLDHDGNLTDEQARIIISNWLLSHPDDDQRFIKSFPSWLKTNKSQGTLYAVNKQRDTPRLPSYRRSTPKASQAQQITTNVIDLISGLSEPDEDGRAESFCPDAAQTSVQDVVSISESFVEEVVEVSANSKTMCDDTAQAHTAIPIEGSSTVYGDWSERGRPRGVDVGAHADEFIKKFEQKKKRALASREAIRGSTMLASLGSAE